jgi:cytochrome c
MRMHAKIMLAIALAAGAAPLAPLAPVGAAKGDNVDGRATFEKRCTGCHALDHEKEGPRLAGVVGRKAGTISTFAYSDAVRKSALVWTEALLDKWLTDPETVIPDNDMSFRLNNPAERAAIIAFLKERGK